jgi:hypothetical protein
MSRSSLQPLKSLAVGLHCDLAIRDDLQGEMKGEELKRFTAEKLKNIPQM